MSITYPKLGKCPYEECRAKINPSNAATNFKNPALSVRIAVEKGIIKAGYKILEVGSGNLRNALFVLKSVPAVNFHSHDLQNTINRFPENYQHFADLGGAVLKTDYGTQKYDLVICTFVLETICPEQERCAVLQSILSVMQKNAVLIASFRGYPGVKGSKYEECANGDGLITPLNTFVKPYSIPEVQSFLSSNGFGSITSLQKYRVARPQNIHIMALTEAQDGEKMA